MEVMIGGPMDGQIADQPKVDVLLYMTEAEQQEGQFYTSIKIGFHDLTKCYSSIPIHDDNCRFAVRVWVWEPERSALTRQVVFHCNLIITLARLARGDRPT